MTRRTERALAKQRQGLRREFKMTRHVVGLIIMAGCLAGSGNAEEVRPGVLRTPDERFQGLPDFDFAPHYKEIDGYRVHYLDEGPSGGEAILLIHGEPTWSYLYRKMIPILTEAGYRCIVPDLIGFGRSDKPTDMDTHTYKFHVDAMTRLVQALDLKNVTFFGQDWGGLIGLRVVAENEALFARVVIANTGLPVGRRQRLHSVETHEPGHDRPRRHADRHHGRKQRGRSFDRRRL